MSLFKSGAGTLTLSGNNQYTGSTAVNAGTLWLGGATALGSIAAGTSVASGAAIDLHGQTVGAEAIAIQGSGVGGNGALTNSGAAASLAGAVMLAAPATVAGSGDIALSGSVTSNMLTKSGVNKLTLTGISDNDSLALIVNAGTVGLAKASSSSVHAVASAGLTINGGTVQLGGTGGDQISDAAAVIINGGIVDFNGRSEAFDALSGSGGSITNAASATTSTMTIGTMGGGGTYAGVIQNGAGTMAVTKTGNGTEFFSGANSYSGATAIGQGMLQGAATDTIPSGSAVNVAAGATFNLGGFSQSIGSLAGAGNVTTVGGSGSDTLTLGNDGTIAAPFSGTISNAPGGRLIGVIKVGSGAATFSGVNTYSGGTTLTQGVLNINNPNALGTGTFTINGVSTIDNTSAAAIALATNNPQIWAASFTFTGTQSLNFGSGTVTLNANPAVTVVANTLSVGPIGSGAGNSLTKAGAGTLFVSGGASYTGTTAVNAGTMTVSGGPFASSASTVSAAATLNFINAANAGSGTFSNTASTNGAANGGVIQFVDNGTTADNGAYTNYGVAILDQKFDLQRQRRRCCSTAARPPEMQPSSTRAPLTATGVPRALRHSSIADRAPAAPRSRPKAEAIRSAAVPPLAPDTLQRRRHGRQRHTHHQCRQPGRACGFDRVQGHRPRRHGDHHD